MTERKIIMKTVFGSRLYGTELLTSDWDYKGVFIPSGRDIVLGTAPRTESTKTFGPNARADAEDSETELFSLKRYLELLMEGQTVALDILFAPYPEQVDNYEWLGIWENKERFISRKCGAAIGYARAQAERYSLRGKRIEALASVVDELMRYHERTLLADIPGLAALCGTYVALESEHLTVNGKSVPLQATAKLAHILYSKMLREYGQRAQDAYDANGADWKALYHAVRIGAQTVEILKTGHIEFPRPDAALLLQIRKGELPVQRVCERIEALVAEILETQKTSTLREEPDKAFADDLVYSAYLEAVTHG